MLFYYSYSRSIHWIIIHGKHYLSFNARMIIKIADISIRMLIITVETVPEIKVPITTSNSSCPVIHAFCPVHAKMIASKNSENDLKTPSLPVVIIIRIRFVMLVEKRVHLINLWEFEEDWFVPIHSINLSVGSAETHIYISPINWFIYISIS